VVMSSETSTYWFAPNMSYLEKDFAAGDRFGSAQLIRTGSGSDRPSAQLFVSVE